MVKTISHLEEWVRDAGIKQPSIYNFAVTDGQNIVTVRYVSDPKIEPISLYVSKRGKYHCREGRPEIIDCCDEKSGIIIASEKLTDDREHWTRIAPNHIVTIDSGSSAKVSLRPNL